MSPAVDDPQYAIPRLKKVSRAALEMSHAARFENDVKPPHAIPEAPGPLVIYNAAPAGVTFKKFVEAAYDKAITAGKVYRPRKDQVLAIEGLLTASPAFFRPHAPGKAGVYTEESVQVLRERGLKYLKAKYGDRLVRVELQLDEVTPHLQFAFLPIDKDGKWSAKNVVTRGFLKALWPEWAAAMDGFGVQAGLTNSAGRHVPVRVFYEAVNQFEANDQKVGEIVTLTPPTIAEPSRLEMLRPSAYAEQVNTQLRNWANSERLRIQDALRPTVAAAASTKLAGRRSKQNRMSNASANKKVAALEKKAASLEKSLTDLQGKFPPAVSIADVQKKLGLDVKAPPKGVVNAVQFLKAVELLDTDPALGWLATQFGIEAAAATVAEIARADLLARAPNLPRPTVLKNDEVRAVLEQQLVALNALEFRLSIRKPGNEVQKRREAANPRRASKAWHRDELLNEVAALKQLVIEGELRIVPETKQFVYVRVSGLSSPTALDGTDIRPCVVLKVGPNTYEAVLRIPADTDSDEAAQSLTYLEQTIACTVTAIDAEHPLRLAGFRQSPVGTDVGNSVNQMSTVELVATADVDFVTTPEAPRGPGLPEI